MHQFGDSARFVVENYGQSQLAERFGVTRYPAIFVDDVLVATPADFGFFGADEGEESGRYAPLRSAESHQRFRDDLTRMIGLLLEGRSSEARAESRAAPLDKPPLARLPDLTLTDLEGNQITRASLAGRVVLVEFWATWCPPCRPTLRWLGELQQQLGRDVAVITIAIQSDEQRVRKLVEEMGLPITTVLGTPELALQFGDIGAVPTLFLFDRDARLAGAYYGAPPTLHAAVESKVASLTQRP